MCPAVYKMLYICDCACAIQQIASIVGTFGRVLECWDRQTREYVAIKVVRSIRKYRDAAMVEVDVLEHLAKNDKGSSRYISCGFQLIEKSLVCLMACSYGFAYCFLCAAVCSFETGLIIAITSVL